MKFSILLCCVSASAAVGGVAQSPQADPNQHPYPWGSASEIKRRLIRQPRPIYPPLAKQARLEGDVRLHVVIDQTGRVAELRALSGPALLIPSAMDAVKQWEYKPFVQNGTPVTVQTYVTVQFHLPK